MPSVSYWRCCWTEVPTCHHAPRSRGVASLCGMADWRPPGMDPNADGGHPNVYLPLHAALAHGHWNWPENVSNAIELLLQVPSTVLLQWTYRLRSPAVRLEMVSHQRGADPNRHSGPHQGSALFSVPRSRPQDFDLLVGSPSFSLVAVTHAQSVGFGADGPRSGHQRKKCPRGDLIAGHR